MDPRTGGGICGGPRAFFVLAADRLKAWVRHQLWMTEDLGGGVSRGAAYEQVRRATGRSEKTIAASPALPACLRHVGDWWAVLLPLYGRLDQLGAVSPSQLAADIEIRFGIAPNMFEINLLQGLLDLSQDHMDIRKGGQK
jgi:hypothetical protein